MKRMSYLILIFAVLFPIFLFGPPLLGYTFTPYPLMKIGDVFDIFTPLVLLPVYWLLYRRYQPEPVNLWGIIAFFIFAGFWAEGQGIHLAGNSIKHLLNGLVAGDIYRLTDFYDEVLGHYLWHFGIIGLSAVLVCRQWKYPAPGDIQPRWPVILAGIIHGFTLAVAILEGVTWWMSIPLAVIMVLFVLIWGRKQLMRQPVVTFFFISYAFALILVIGWGIVWQGLPEPMSALGI